MNDISKILVVLVSGKAGVGKTTLANMMVKGAKDLGLNSYVDHFAGDLKFIAKVGFDWNGEKDERGRTLLQDIGTISRKYDENIWARRLYERVVSSSQVYHLVVIDDWRFPNELAYLKDKPMLEVFSVNIHAPNREILAGTPQYNDVSETSLPDSYTTEGDLFYNITVDNRGDIDTLNITSKNLLKYILEHCNKWE